VRNLAQNTNPNSQEGCIGDTNMIFFSNIKYMAFILEIIISLVIFGIMYKNFDRFMRCCTPKTWNSDIKI